MLETIIYDRLKNANLKLIYYNDINYKIFLQNVSHISNTMI